MQKIEKLPLEELGQNFVPDEFLPEGEDKNYLREMMRDKSIVHRNLRPDEIEILVRNKNFADDWNNIWVTEKFDPNLVRGNSFFGLIRIGDLERVFLKHHDLELPVGIYDSTIVSCEIGNNVVIDNVDYLSYYFIYDNVILRNVQEMITTNHSKFGNGVVKDGEDESVRIEIELSNENGNRAIYPYDGILSADCFLWSKYRDKKVLMKQFEKFTQDRVDSRRGFYGTVGERSIIKNCRIIKDVKVGSDAYIKGANKLKNLTVRSREDAGTQIGEGVELVNGIIGYGCRVFYGVKAVRFILADHSQLKYGARLINSYLGENSTISCCEVLNSLLFPFHEQHHNNSFLIAATVLGQSNIGAGATIGSNHNSRSPDGEIFAKRGFWPGLSTNFKHFSKFSSFCLVAKGNYDYELDIKLPFSLTSIDKSSNSLTITPAYWFLYNMYALARNPIKFKKRDKRKHFYLNFEFDYLAPDTVCDILSGLEYLKECVALSSYKVEGREAPKNRATILKYGEKLLTENEVLDFPVYAFNSENSNRDALILKSSISFKEYKSMLVFYVVKALIRFNNEYQEEHSKNSKVSKNREIIELLNSNLKKARFEEWQNLGGQLVKNSDVEKIIKKVEGNSVNSWTNLHKEYKKLAESYNYDNMLFALSTIPKFLNVKKGDITKDFLYGLIKQSKNTMKEIVRRTKETREKDYLNPFRMLTYDNEQERDAVLGKLEENDFISTIKDVAKEFNKDVDILLKSL